MIPPAVMRELRLIELATARRMRTPRVGPFTSRQRGGGFDFDELQPYHPGDDVRRIDWNVTARLDAPYVRHTHAERELNMVIAVDVSRSMELGTSQLSKREAMMHITASLVFSALATQVNTGFVAFSDRVLLASPPRRTRAAAWSMLEQCWTTDAAGGRTALRPAIRQLTRTLRRMTMVFLVSDFITGEDLFGSPELAMLAAAHDVIAVVPEDPIERALPAGAGLLVVRDLESGRRATIALGEKTRGRFAAHARRHRERLVRGFYRSGIDHVFVPTDGPALEPLLSLFATRLRQ
jgi:uncharacterized protein (DUF58 family)